MTTYHIFGDTGGHFQQLFEGLLSIGMEPKTHRLPKDTVVVHCGDLIHKGPDSLGVLTLVDAVMEANPGRWIQLLGNHEFQYIKGAPTFWPQVIPVEGQLILQSWLLKRRLRVAYGIPGPLVVHDLGSASTAVDTEGKGVLLVHGGLTHDFWVDWLQEETSVVALAETINGLPIPVVTRPGEMLFGFPEAAGEPVGPVWAAGPSEVWASWVNQGPMPFVQIHGHTNPYSYTRGEWWPSAKLFQENSSPNRGLKHTVTEVAGSMEISVDPGYSKFASAGPQPALRLTTK